MEFIKEAQVAGFAGGVLACQVLLQEVPGDGEVDPAFESSLSALKIRKVERCIFKTNRSLLKKKKKKAYLY